MTRGGSEGDDTPAGFVLDSCQVLNLYATRKMPEILRALQRTITITDFTLTSEAQWVGSGRKTEPGSDVEEVVLAPMIHAGLLRVARIETDEEADWFVRFAATMDDGEAMAGAIAISRGMLLGTDDRRAASVFSGLT